MRGTKARKKRQRREGEKKSGTGSEAGMRRRRRGRGRKRRAENESWLSTDRTRGSPSQITPVYALKCEMVQTAQLP